MYVYTYTYIYIYIHTYLHTFSHTDVWLHRLILTLLCWVSKLRCPVASPGGLVRDSHIVAFNVALWYEPFRIVFAIFFLPYCDTESSQNRATKNHPRPESFLSFSSWGLLVLNPQQDSSISFTDWWFGTWLLFSQIYWECLHPNWLSYFSEGFSQPPTSSVSRTCCHSPGPRLSRPRLKKGLSWGEVLDGSSPWGVQQNYYDVHLSLE